MHAVRSAHRPSFFFIIIKMPDEEYKLRPPHSKILLLAPGTWRCVLHECASISRTCHPPHLRRYVPNVPSNYKASHATNHTLNIHGRENPKDWWNHKCQYRKDNNAIVNCGNSSSDATTNWNVILYPIFKVQWSLYVWPGLTFTKSTFCPHSIFVLCGSENKQRLFPYTALTHWFYKRYLTL